MRANVRKSGLALVAIVFILTAIVGILASAFAFAAGSRALASRKRLFLEQAMYVAEAGAERAVAHLAAKGAVPATLTATVGDGVYVATIALTNVVGQASLTYVIRSAGTVKGMTRTVVIDGARQKTWAKYALWSDNNRRIYFKTGETFYGPVHANSELWFSGSPEFFARVTSTAATFGGSTNDCTFHMGFHRGVQTDTMANVDFNDLKSDAALVTTGATTVAFQGTNMTVSNAARGWANRVMPVPPGSVIYVETQGAQAGTATVQGRLDGRVTIAAAQDVLIAGNLTYADDPATNGASNDALGLIAGRDIVVTTSFPDNGRIYAHMMATGKATPTVDTDGSFGVQNYWSRPPSGRLTMYGGIVQAYRGAVGTFSGPTLVSGFDKNYTYDQRFSVDPPPEYPPLSNEFGWNKWRERNG